MREDLLVIPLGGRWLVGRVGRAWAGCRRRARRPRHHAQAVAPVTIPGFYTCQRCNGSGRIRYNSQRRAGAVQRWMFAPLGRERC